MSERDQRNILFLISILGAVISMATILVIGGKVVAAVGEIKGTFGTKIEDLARRSVVNEVRNNEQDKDISKLQGDQRVIESRLQGLASQIGHSGSGR